MNNTVDKKDFEPFFTLLHVWPVGVTAVLRSFTAEMLSMCPPISPPFLAFLSDGWTGMPGLITSCSLFSL